MEQHIGSIPPTLGRLSLLLKMDLSSNKLSGSIPPDFGGLSQLTHLELENNELSGSIPPEMGSLSQLTLLRLHNNKLSGPIPSTIGNLTALDNLRLLGNYLTGVPIPGESIGTWRLRLKYQDRSSYPTSLATNSAEAPMEPVDKFAVPSQILPDLPPELLQLTRENRAMLDKVLELIDIHSTTFNAMPQAACLRELDRLVGMARHLGEIVASKMEDDDMEQIERSLVLGSMEEAHYNTLKDGLCKAYLASCVVGSKLVSTCQTGTMGTVGKALKFIADVTPGLGGLGSVAVTALEFGDHYVQTQRVTKIAEIASDVVECSKIAKKVAMKITAGLQVGEIITKDARSVTNTGRVGRVSFYAAGLGRPMGGPEDSVDAEVVLDWFAEEVASDVSGSIASATHKGTAAKDGKRYGEKHLCMLLKAIGRDCLRNAANTDAKIEALVAVVQRGDVPKEEFPELRIEQKDVETSRHKAFPGMSSSVNVEVLMARLAAMEAAEAKRAGEMEALKRQNSEAEAKRAAEMEALKRQNSEAEAKRAAEMEALKRQTSEAEAKRAAEMEALKRQNSEAEAKRAAEMEALKRQTSEAEAKRVGEMEALKRQNSEAEAKRAAEMEALKRQNSEAEAKRVAEMEALKRQNSEAEAKRAAEMEALKRQNSEAEAKRVGEMEALKRQNSEAEAKRAAEMEALKRQTSEAEAKRAAEMEALKHQNSESEAKRVGEMEALKRQNSEAEAKRAAEMEALKRQNSEAEAKRVGEMEALKRQNSEAEAKRVGEMEALKRQTSEAEAKRAGEMKALKRQNSEFRKKITKLEENSKDKEVSGSVAAGGGQLYANKQVRKQKTANDFWRRAEEGGSCGEGESMEPEELERLKREKKAIKEERLEMIEERVARLECASIKTKTRAARGSGGK